MSHETIMEEIIHMCLRKTGTALPMNIGMLRLVFDFSFLQSLNYLIFYVHTYTLNSVNP